MTGTVEFEKVLLAVNAFTWDLGLRIEAGAPSEGDPEPCWEYHRAMVEYHGVCEQFERFLQDKAEEFQRALDA